MTAAVADTVDSQPDASWSDQLVAWTLRNWMALVNAVVLVACSVTVLAVLHPDLLLTNTTTAGGDTGAHVWWPAFLRDFLLPEGKLAGWSKDFYAGFPAGQFYFPIPALLIVLLDVALPYNIAFKLVTAVGAVALPASAFVFGRGLRLRFPAPLFMGIATLAFLFFRGDPRATAPFTNAAFNQRIMGGTLASTLAGEFSFTIALCFALCFLGVFALTLRGGRRPVWAALLLAATVLSHVIVGIFVAVAALVVLAFRFFLDPERREAGGVARRPGLVVGGLVLLTLLVGVATISVWWTLPFGLAAIGAAVWFALGDRNRMVLIAVAIGGVGALLTALWSIPLVARFPYTSNMAYEKIITSFDLSDPADGLNLYLFPNYGSSGIFPWVFLFGLVGLFVAIAFWRPGVLVLATITLLMGVLFVQWPELHAWNLRFLPFWYLGWLFLAAVGMADIVRVPGLLATMPSRSAPTGDGDDEPLPAELEAKQRRERRVARKVALGLTAGMTLVVAFGGVVMAANNTGFLGYWAQYNYTGYEWVSEQTAAAAGDVELPESGPCTNPPKQANKYNNSGKAYPEYASIMKTMGELPPGRALWEPSAAIDKYGTTLALMLLPYCTDHRIASSEGLYFEAAGTTAYHFITVSQVSSEPSNPMRFPGIPTPYGRPSSDFDLGVRHMQMLGIRYYMAQSDTAKGYADVHPALRLVADIPDRDQIAPLGWKVYEVQDAPLVEPLQYEPVVVADQGSSGWQQSGSQWLTDWFNDSEALDRLLVADGPKEWARADAADARGVAFGAQLPEVTVTDVREREQSVSFRVSQTGVPVLVKTSYYPNWKVTGAKGVYRASPNFMVVVPTSEEVTLRFERAGVDWLGILLTLLGLVAIVPLARWKPRAAFADEGLDINADLDPFAVPDEPGAADAPVVATAGHDSDHAEPATATSDSEVDLESDGGETDGTSGVVEPEPGGADDDRS